MSKLKGKTAVITGAGSGFGKKTAYTFAKKGAKLILVDIDYVSVKEVSEEINNNMDTESIAIKADVSNKDDVMNMKKETFNYIDKLDILINNAGKARSARIQDISLEDWHDLIEVNLTSQYLCCKAFIDHMIERKYGKIVNVASICAVTGRTVGVDYSASKSGVVGLTRTLAAQVAPKGINVNAIAPGPIITPLFEENFTQEVINKLQNTIPYKRGGTTEDIANLMLFLASDESGWITGEVISINGGAFMG